MLLHSVPTAISHFGEHPSISLPDNCALSPLSLKETCRCSALFKVQLRMAQLTAKYLTSIQASDLVVLSLQHLCVPNEILYSRLRALWRKKKKKNSRKRSQKKKELTGLVSVHYQIVQNIHDWFLRFTVSLISRNMNIYCMHLLFLLNLATCTLEVC